MTRLELLVSGPGTGKTSYCIELFKKNILRSKGGIDSRSFFILPSREHAERIQNLILKKEVPGLFNAHILTINELASKVLGPSAGRSPNDAVRRAIIAEILQDRMPGKPSPVFGFMQPVSGFSGFHDLILETIKEFKSGLLTSKEFEKLCQPLLKEEVFRRKFRDFSVLFKNYENRLRRMGFREPEDDFLSFQEKIRRVEPAQLVIFDGFYHFTRAQRHLIRALSRWADHVTVTLTVSDPGQKRRSLFEYPERTRAFLVDIGFKEKKGLFGTNHRTRDAALLHIERNIFSEVPDLFEGSQEAVTLMQAPSVHAEMEMIARIIRKLHRQTAVHFSDICVLLRNVGVYEKSIRSVFESFGIPVFIHERQKLIENGLGRVLYRFLSLAAQNWKREDLFFVLKSSYFSSRADLGDVLEFESRSAAENVLEGQNQWDGLAAQAGLSPAIGQVLRDLGRFQDRLRDSQNIGDFQTGIMSFIEYLNEGERETGRSLRENNAQAMRSIETILRSARIREISPGSEPFSSAAFGIELQGSLETCLYSVKPRGKNRVQVYDVVMALPKEYKVVFMAGLLEKGFPQMITEDPLFKDSERKRLNRKDIVLEERLPRIGGERYFFYMGITRAKERLYLSHPLYDWEGRPALGSFFIEEVEKCFGGTLPALKKGLADLLPETGEWESEPEVTRGLSEILFRPGLGDKPSPRAPDAAIPGLLGDWIGRESFREILRFGLAEDTAVLRDQEIAKIFRQIEGPFSATKLEIYATCAFKYFADRMLHLNKPLEDRRAAEEGNLLHKTLETYYKELPQSQRQSGAFLEDTRALKEALYEKLKIFFEKSPFRNEVLYRQRIYLDSMRKALDAFAVHEKELFYKRGLVPSYFELSFGKKGAELSFLKIRDGASDVRLEGQIDRVDVTPDGQKALIVDYKRSARELGVHEKLARGLEFQLPLYMLALKQLLHLEPLGAELRILRDPKEQGLYTEEAAQLLGLNVRKYVELEPLLSGAQQAVLANIRRLRAADISVRPKSCKFCDFASVCRFEPWKIVYIQEVPDEA